jgi:N-acetylglucosamine kinase-like BadF-type ATPase
MTHTIHLGLDVGGTGSRWVACDEHGDVVTRGRTVGATGHVFNPAEKARLREVLSAIGKDLAEAGLSAGGVLAGLTGFGPAATADVNALLRDTLGVPEGSTVLVDDMSLAYAANFEPGEGHLVSAGTGSIGLHFGPEQVVRVGGRGILIDVAG